MFSLKSDPVQGWCLRKQEILDLPPGYERNTSTYEPSKALHTDTYYAYSTFVVVWHK